MFFVSFSISIFFFFFLSFFLTFVKIMTFVRGEIEARAVDGRGIGNVAGRGEEGRRGSGEEEGEGGDGSKQQ